MSIAETVRQCIGAFDNATDIFGEDVLLDQLGRFRAWMGNVSAHTTGKRSLQYRLRESYYLSTTVIGYLTDLSAVLRGQERQNIHVGNNESDGNGSYDEDDQDDEDDGALFGIYESTPTASRSEAIEEISSIITCLMRVSMALRNPAKDDQVRYALDVSVEHFEPHDIEHVRTKFPRVGDDVVQTLTSALARHRRYFKYREDHHEKLNEGIDERQTNGEERPSTVATSLVLKEKVVSGLNTFNDTGSICTATSYATTRAGASHLSVPPLPDAGAEGEPFECPICFHVIEAPDERSWRRHVYEDLPPYVCITSDCGSRGRQFARRRDWRRHLKEHDTCWVCPFDCSDAFNDPGSFKKHLKAVHLHDKCDYAAENLLSSSARIGQGPECVRCPLCFEGKQDAKTYYKHLGHHMEQLALFALPSRLYGDAEESDSAPGESDVALNVASVPISSPEPASDGNFSPSGRFEPDTEVLGFGPGTRDGSYAASEVAPFNSDELSHPVEPVAKGEPPYLDQDQDQASRAEPLDRRSFHPRPSPEREADYPPTKSGHDSILGLPD
ncbi:hypothetical protein M409DRAFT_56674 [Zasmidium cellare ATCC 36951]|uniref:C2H2-type domain-containing protein n=1 Tax=Zasmidium cellare ATCC 36951 TaxID=1080233 RepID=A0A6A6CBI0_ZASCE|nr:uncharacterized protein M409DRAFT_56674 [Zasmidium cellare ATCC 36951]KAF2164405.1 hypothetical protein M409DRAFT_56674 [Zasmidium cellare ATCC 36951]